MSSPGSLSDWIAGAAAVATALGMLMMAFFPLAIPFAVLVIAVTLPLVLPLVALGVLAAILINVWRLIRKAGRDLHRLRNGRERTGVSGFPAPFAGESAGRGRSDRTRAADRAQLRDEGI
jgi:hypothetical protein